MNSEYRPFITRPIEESGATFEELYNKLTQTDNPVTYSSIANILQERLKSSIKSGTLK